MAVSLPARVRLIRGNGPSSGPDQCSIALERFVGEVRMSVVALAAMCSAGVVAQGGYHRGGQWLLAGALVLGVVAAGRERRWRSCELGDGVVFWVLAVLAWIALRAVLVGDPAAGFGAVALLLGCVAVVLIGRRTTVVERHILATVVVAAACLAAVTAWAGVAWRWSRWATPQGEVWRGTGTVTYANATAGLLVPALLLVISRAALRTSPQLRAVACLLLIGLGATLSRGGLLALGAGTVVAVGLLGGRAVLLAVAPPTTGAMVALSALVPSFRADVPARPAIAVVGLAAGLATSWWLSGSAGRARRATISLAGAVVATGVIAAIALASVSRAGSVSSSSGDRIGASVAAIELAQRHALMGVGPGRATVAWHDEEFGVLSTRYVHNEYLQVLVEYGIVGVVLVAALVVAIGRSASRGIADASPELRVGVAAALVAFAVHSGADFLWHIPIIPLTAALLVGVLTSTTKEETW